MKRNHNTESITLERLEAALAIIARAIVLDGPVYGPYLERLEREIAAFRTNDNTVSRAQRYLSFHDAPSTGGIPGAIRLASRPPNLIGAHYDRRRRP